MRSRNFAISCLAALGVAAMLLAVSTSASKSADDGPSLDAGSPPPLPAPSPEEEAAGAPAGAEVQTRGQVHEAFAQPLDANPEPNPVIEKRPPEPIDEIPPDAAPEGENVVWIGGYWAWDEDRNDYVWISGVYRNSPKYQTWVAGYWSQVPNGYQWTSGFWATTAKGEVNYVQQAPPPSQELEPSSPQPDENHFWIPGNYVYRETRYAWQPGYWSACQPGWVWNPAHWVWSPAGYVFVDGFWDYPVDRRGCLFAPVYFAQPIYVQPAFAWRPRVLINIGLFNDCLFTGPRFCHYYWGDYFAAQYATVGFRPWFSVNVNIGGGRGGYRYDPLFTYYNWNNVRRNPNWVAQSQRRFDQFRENPTMRPPRTFVAQQELLAKAGPNRRTDLAFASTINQASKNPSDIGGVKLQKISQRDQQQFLTQAKEFRKVTQERVKIEKDNSAIGLAGGAGGLLNKGTDTDKTPGAGGTGTGRGPGFGGDDNSKMKTLKLPTITPTKTTIAGGNAAGNNGGNGGGNLGGSGGGQNPGAGTGTGSGAGNLGGRNGRAANGNTFVQNPGGDNNSQIGKGNGNQIYNQNQTNNSNQQLNSRTGRGNLTDINPGAGGSGTAGSGAAGGNPNVNTIQKGNTRLLNQGAAGSGGAAGNSGAGGNSGSGANSGAAGNGGGGGNGGGQNGYGGRTGQTIQGQNGAPRSFGQGSGAGGGGGNGGGGYGGGNFGAGGGGGGGSNQANQIRSLQPQQQPQQPKFTPPSGGGGGGGNKNPPAKDDDDKKKKTSDAGSPRTNMNLMPTEKPSVRFPESAGLASSNRSAQQSPSAGGIPDAQTGAPLGGTAAAPESKSNPLDTESKLVDKFQNLGSAPDNTAQDNGAPKKPDDGGRNMPRISIFDTPKFGSTATPMSGNDSGKTAQGSDPQRGGNSGTTSTRDPRFTSGNISSNSNSGKSGGGTADSGSGYVTRPGQDPRAAKISSASKYDYDSLLKRGQSLSQNSGLVSGTPTATGADPTRRTKDPLSSIGMGASSGRSMYGPSGLGSPSGPSGDASQSYSSGGYMSQDAMPQLPKYQRSGSFSGSGSGSGSFSGSYSGRSLGTPESRTYDPRNPN